MNYQSCATSTRYWYPMSTACAIPYRSHSRAHQSHQFQRLLRENGICYAYVPPACTDRLQHFDLSFNFDYNENVNGCFHQWYCGQVVSPLDDGDADMTTATSVNRGVADHLYVWVVTEANPTLTITPSSVIIGGDANDVTTTSPLYVNIECRMSGVQQVYSLYIKRGPTQDSLAEISIGNPPRVSTNAPNDILQKIPEVTGMLGTSGNLLSVRYRQDRLDCVDGNSYQLRPGNLQLLAARVVNEFMTEPVMNNSLVQPGEQLELTCTGSIGASPDAPIQWFRRTAGSQLVFQYFTPIRDADYISEGEASGISTPICHYSRTSMLRYTVEAADSDLGFRCQVTSQQQMTYTAHSPDYTFMFDRSGMNSGDAAKVSFLISGYLLT
ncbi:hypothetical protein MAR_019567, partial [Mya arenaria]